MIPLTTLCLYLLMVLKLKFISCIQLIQGILLKRSLLLNVAWKEI